MDKDLKLIMFDLDNTLFPFDELWRDANKKAFDNYKIIQGIEYDDFIPLYRSYDDYFWKQHDAGLISLDELRELRLIKTLEDFGIYISHKDANEYFQMFFNILISNIKMNPKLNELLATLKKDIHIAILTNGKIREQTKKIKNLNLDFIFKNNIFISEEIGVEKPDAKAFLKVTKALNVTPEATLFVGDSWKNDICGALNVNMQAVWLNTSNQNEQIERNNLCIFNGQIESLIEKLINR
ncbi:HAD family hydrolase [Staphylococcus equorum]|uniref:HAD family hydrolase n=1 Tax=Staphylococcus equorum TaxID=246432 RepID=A0A9X4R0C0_9STAP|nr:HAD family hydrolase [Staphylococcus equorum]MDG0841993.1 HAD family hydrolase [Staphylococcus equorum]MDG0857955.1 HAD family hydrolase [Staphylococcus equorum]